ncbi:hypothetical protein N332_05505, partial [Mesitornis unicolor]
MKLRALCDTQRSTKSITSLLCSAKPTRSPKAENGGAEGSKPEVSAVPKHRDRAKGRGGNQGTAKAIAKKPTQSSNLSSAKGSTALPPATTQRRAPGQQRQLLPLPKICSK